MQTTCLDLSEDFNPEGSVSSLEFRVKGLINSKPETRNSKLSIL